jgi:hypothetical protein
VRIARAVSAKTHDFDAAGNETTKDYRRLLKIVLDASYHSWIGIEYEGHACRSAKALRGRCHCWSGSGPR